MLQWRPYSAVDDVAKIRYLIAVCNHVESSENGGSRNDVCCYDRFFESYHGMSRICAPCKKLAAAVGAQFDFNSERPEKAS